ncbi:hypothetical protein [Actinoplanes sp. NPDC051411]|uniref:hypothetical protein n=1 Tax=Actinoplanes sp. NPDC051411 TaxID=3155522 RepID=UPI00342E034C
MPVEEIFFRMARFREFDAAELSLGSYLVSGALSGPFVAIPVFPSRSFRHSGIYVPVDSEVSDPSSLAGGTVGRARQIALDGMAETAALRYMLPWLAANVEHAQRVFGDRYWTYGLPGNSDTLETVIRYAHSQGLIDRPLAAADLFAPETLADTVI